MLLSVFLSANIQLCLGFCSYGLPRAGHDAHIEGAMSALGVELRPLGEGENAPADLQMSARSEIPNGESLTLPRSSTEVRFYHWMEGGSQLQVEPVTLEGRLKESGRGCESLPLVTLTVDSELDYATGVMRLRSNSTTGRPISISKTPMSCWMTTEPTAPLLVPADGGLLVRCRWDLRGPLRLELLKMYFVSDNKTVAACTFRLNESEDRSTWPRLELRHAIEDGSVTQNIGVSLPFVIESVRIESLPECLAAQAVLERGSWLINAEIADVSGYRHKCNAAKVHCRLVDGRMVILPLEVFHFYHKGHPPQSILGSPGEVVTLLSTIEGEDRVHCPDRFYCTLDCLVRKGRLELDQSRVFRLSSDVEVTCLAAAEEGQWSIKARVHYGLGRFIQDWHAAASHADDVRFVSR